MWNETPFLMAWYIEIILEPKHTIEPSA